MRNYRVTSGLDLEHLLNHPPVPENDRQDGSLLRPDACKYELLEWKTNAAGYTVVWTLRLIPAR